jgi:Fe2+ transport system protein FeoA
VELNLAEIAKGQLVVVDQVGGERAFRRRLMELGFVKGTRVELIGVAPLGDPMEFLVRGSSLSIRRAEAREIRVTTVTGSVAAASEARATDSELVDA